MNIFRVKSKTSSLFCSFLLLFFCFFLEISAFAQLQTGNQSILTTSLDDLDNDGLKDVTVETDLLRVVISSKTGSPSVYYLKGSNFEENILPSTLQDQGVKLEENFLKPFTADIVGVDFSSGYKIEVEDEQLNSVVIRAIANIPPPKDGQESISLVKRFTFSLKNYFFDAEYIVTNLNDRKTVIGDETNGSVKMSFGPGLFMDPFGPSTLLGLEASGNVQSFSDFTKLNSAGLVAGALNGVGIRDQYFCVLIESAVPQVKVNAVAFDVQGEKDGKKIKHRGHLMNCVLPMFALEPNDSRSLSFKVYAGPMILDELMKVNRPTVSEYGFLSTMLMRILQFFYSLFPNYGLAIILLTIVVRIVLYPLTLKQTKSMAAMQKIAPKVQDLKDRFKDNPQKLNEEILKLYQKNNVNPLGGCLPLLLQLPVLIALYNTIRIAVELRKTPFLWIADLSKGDPLLILPIAIAILMYVTQAKQASVDPQQKQMMAMMPMFMFVITWSLPAGLLVYWFASSVLGILQQYQANRIMAAMKEE
ncbi:MAG: YidC/Oxa1 family insertase periplasmic-domain containing protein [Candidatus Ozemobacteraceae bacterium]|jgi:YidC/Oxa1 family membrane protein insertase